MVQDINKWRADYLMLAAKRLEIHIAKLQKQADEYREIARKALAQTSGDGGTEAMHARPCIICGTKNYAPSLGGQEICPSCDCGFTAKIHEPFAMEKLEARVAAIEALINANGEKK